MSGTRPAPMPRKPTQAAAALRQAGRRRPEGEGLPDLLLAALRSGDGWHRLGSGGELSGNAKDHRHW